MHSLRPYVTAGVGLRRYGLSWTPVGRPNDSFFLDGDSYGETDFLGRVAVGFALDLGAFAATLEGGADLTAFGAGRVPVPTDQLARYAEPAIDLGRTNLQEYTVSIGVPLRAPLAPGSRPGGGIPHIRSVPAP